VGTQLGAVWRSSCTPKVGGRVWMFAARLCATLTCQYQLYCHCPGLKKREELSSDGVDRDWPSGRSKHSLKFWVQGRFCELHRFFLAPPPLPTTPSTHLTAPRTSPASFCSLFWAANLMSIYCGLSVWCDWPLGQGWQHGCLVPASCQFAHCTCSQMCIARAGIG
jgi:hypothetical protein